MARLRFSTAILAFLCAAGFEGSAAVGGDPQYVGGELCQACHEKQAELWRASHHDLAMQPANAETVLGDFDNARFTYAGTTSTFSQRGERYFVNTDGPDGDLADFEVRYTFGVDPLQQYLVELPGGRLQALTIAWDTRSADQGGQRWFHLYPGESVTHEDELHWTRLNHNWNTTCAECHSTHLDKNYDPGTRSYATTWSDIDVSCEACHGPGSNHVGWAERSGGWERFDTPLKGLTHRLDERAGVVWLRDAASGKPRRSAPRESQVELETCAACHSRRAQLFEDDRYGQPLMDAYLPALLEGPNYHVDGQIDGEVYVYGSFLQSRMHQAGVTCSDCHEPHSLQLRAPGNGVCLQCHAGADYDDRKHHFHASGGAGAQCVDCHMPAKNFMVVDPRRDHSFRIPRPDLSARFGAPNACNGCHTDRQAAWAADKLREWYGQTPRGLQNYAAALQAARAGGGNTAAELSALLGDGNQPAIARATAAAALQSRLDPDAVRALIGVIDAADPLLRHAAIQGLAALPPEYRWQVMGPLLDDPVRAVRIAAGEALADIPPERLDDTGRARLRAAIDAYIASQDFNAEHASAQVNLGNLHTAQRKFDRAEEAYRLALELDPGWVPAYVNLADLFRLTGRDAQGISLLHSGLERRPRSADLYHGLGLAQVRVQQLSQALESLREAAALAPDNPRYTYVYAVALHSAGRTGDALAYVADALQRFPDETALYQLREQLSGAP
jgi:tetratricopeptide (TPR) repeat protein